MRAAIIGCGFVGQKRARALAGCQLVACADAIGARAETVARMVPGAQPLSQWRDILGLQDVDIVIVSTTHDALAEVALAAISAGKHVLVEKPGARRAVELDPLIEAAERAHVLVRVGFNHRYHPATRT